MMGKGKAVLALLAPSGSSKGDSEGSDEESDTEGADYDKVMLSAAKDILDAEDPKALKAALYEFVCAAMKQEDGEGE